MRNKYKIGDVVKIIDYGYCYTTYKDMFVKLGFKNKVANHHNANKFRNTPANDALWEIWNIKFPLVAVKNVYGKELLVGIDGIKLLKNNKMYKIY